MSDNTYFLSPNIWAVIYRIVGVILLCLLWINTSNSITGLFFILFIIILNLLRWRFENLKWTLILDQALCIFITMFWENAAYGLGVFAFDTAFLGSIWVFIPTFFYSIFYELDVNIIFFILSSLFIGGILRNWQKQRNEVLMQMNQDSKKRYELESLKNDLLTANIQVARMAEISERSRIAREIHDNAGHEIIAAYMSLQVVENSLNSEELQVKEMFKESMNRLENGIDKIREAVHNLAPLTQLGIDYLKELCNEFTMCSITFKVYGDTSKIPIYLWSILEPCLKEALTNILRHTKAENVAVTLDVTPFIVRLSVENDGVKEKIKTRGIGIRNLQYRATAIGGNISINTSENFQLICVLPIEYGR